MHCTPDTTRRIWALLTTAPRTPVRTIGAQLHLSKTAVHHHMRHLADLEYIELAGQRGRTTGVRILVPLIVRTKELSQ